MREKCAYEKKNKKTLCTKIINAVREGLFGISRQYLELNTVWAPQNTMLKKNKVLIMNVKACFGGLWGKDIFLNSTLCEFGDFMNDCHLVKVMKT